MAQDPGAVVVIGYGNGHAYGRGRGMGRNGVWVEMPPATQHLALALMARRTLTNAEAIDVLFADRADGGPERTNRALDDIWGGELRNAFAALGFKAGRVGGRMWVEPL